MAVFDNPEEAADHVTWLTPWAIGTNKTIECTGKMKLKDQGGFLTGAVRVPSWWHQGQASQMLI